MQCALPTHLAKPLGQCVQRGLRYGKRACGEHLGDARIVRPDPLGADDRGDARIVGDVVRPDHPVATLVERIDPRFLIAERHALKTVTFHRLLDRLAELDRKSVV